MFKMCPLTFFFQIVPTPQRRPRLLHWHCFPPGRHHKLLPVLCGANTSALTRYRSWPVLKPLPGNTVCTALSLQYASLILWALSNVPGYEICTAVKSSFGGLTLNESLPFTIQTNFYIFSHWRSATKAAGRQADNISNFQHSGRCSTAASLSVRWVIPTPRSNTKHILTHKRGKWTPSRGVFPVHCKGNFAVCDNARFFCELFSPWRCWTSVCTGCCPALCYRNRRWEVPRLGSSPQPRGPVPQSRLSVSSPLTKGDKLRRWRFFSPSLQFDRSKRVYKVVVGRHCRTGVCSVVRWSRTKSQLKR